MILVLLVSRVMKICRVQAGEQLEGSASGERYCAAAVKEVHYKI